MSNFVLLVYNTTITCSLTNTSLPSPAAPRVGGVPAGPQLVHAAARAPLGPRGAALPHPRLRPQGEPATGGAVLQGGRGGGSRRGQRLKRDIW